MINMKFLFSSQRRSNKKDGKFSTSSSLEKPLISLWIEAPMTERHAADFF
jgi:hypothetical protein